MGSEMPINLVKISVIKNMRILFIYNGIAPYIIQIHSFTGRKLALAAADLHCVDISKISLFNTKGTSIKPSGDVRYVPMLWNLLKTAPQCLTDDEQNKRWGHLFMHNTHTNNSYIPTPFHNSLLLGWNGSNFKSLIFKLIIQNSSFDTRLEIAFRCKPYTLQMRSHHWFR